MARPLVIEWYREFRLDRASQSIFEAGVELRQFLFILIVTWKLIGKWIVLLGAGWFGLWWRRWRRNARQRGMEGWPSITGRILYGKVAAVPKTTKYLATLTYSYFVDEFRSGTYDQEFSSELGCG